MIYSAENRVSQLARLLIQFGWADNSYQKYFQWLGKWFIKHSKQFTYKEMLEQMAIGFDMGFDADMIFIDPTTL